MPELRGVGVSMLMFKAEGLLGKPGKPQAIHGKGSGFRVWGGSIMLQDPNSPEVKSDAGSPDVKGDAKPRR